MRPNNESDAQVERKTSGMKAIRSISIRMMLAMSAIAILGALLLVIGVILGSRHELSERGFSPNDVTSGALFHGSLIIDSEKAIIFIIICRWNHHHHRDGCMVSIPRRDQAVGSGHTTAT